MFIHKYYTLESLEALILKKKHSETNIDHESWYVMIPPGLITTPWLLTPRILRQVSDFPQHAGMVDSCKLSQQPLIFWGRLHTCIHIPEQKTIKNILHSRTSRTMNKQNLWKRCKKTWHFPPNLYCLPTFVTHQHWSFPFQVSNHMPGGWSIATGQGCPLTFIFQCHTVKANASSTFTALLWRKSPANPKLEQSYLKMVTSTGI